MQAFISRTKPVFGAIKPYLRWAILGGTFFFVASTLRYNWQEVAAIQVQDSGLACLTVATGVTLLSHIWSGWVWSWILQVFSQDVSRSWSVRVYLKTNIAKYLPGNVWHFYGRIVAAKTVGIPMGASTLSVILEPLLMIAAALIIGFSSYFPRIGIWSVVLVILLLGLHPKVLNPLLMRFKRVKGKMVQDSSIETNPVQLQHYPWKPLVGELGFVGLRSAGFLLTMIALHPIGLDQVARLISAFSVAWLLGLIVPGAPGGIGVFEATAISLLSGQFSAGLILGVVAFYRLISTVAEVIGAGLAWLDERLDHQHFTKQGRTFR